MNKYIKGVLLLGAITSSMLYPKGFMALKSDLGYEAEHQRPQTSEARPTTIERTTIQDYRVDYGQNLAIPSGSGTTDENHDPYFLDHQIRMPGSEWNDIDAQTLYEVDYPYRHAAD